VGDGNTTYYTIVAYSGTEWEVGIGTYTASGTTLSRNTVLSSSNSGSLVNFSAGTKDVFVDYPAGRAVYEDAAGNVDGYPITGGTINNTVIGGTTPAAGTFTTLRSTDQADLGGISGQESLRVISTASSTTPMRVVGTSATAGGFWSTGSIAFSCGTTQMSFRSAASSTNPSAGPEQFRVSHTASAVNYVQVTGAATGSGPILSVQGSDTNAGLAIRAKGSGFITLGQDSTSQFGVSRTASAVNYLLASGSTAGNAITLSSFGTDTNISQVFQSKGTGAIDLAAGSSGVNISNGGTVTAITRASAGGGYTGIPAVAVSAPTTAGGVQATVTTSIGINSATIANGGTGYSVNDVVTLVGGTFVTVASQFTVTSVSGGVVTGITASVGANYTAFPTQPAATTGGTGTGLTLSNLSGFVPSNGFTITNAGSGYVEQPTISFSGGGGSGAAAYATVGSNTTVRGLGNAMDFYTSSANIGMRVYDAGGNGNGYWRFPAGFSSTATQISSSAGGNIAAGGTGLLSFQTNNTTTQMAVSHTASAVNYVQVTGAATSGRPVISAQGSDTNIGLNIQTKGTGSFFFATGGSGLAQFVVSNTSSSVNYIQVTGAVTTGSPTISALGNDTNIDLNLTPKGTGGVVLGNNQANYADISGGATTKAVEFNTLGSDTNVAVALRSKGTGAIDLAAGSSGVNISNGGTVTAITRTNAGSGYTSIPAVAISAPTTAGGVQATASVTTMSALGTAVVVSGGTGYAVGNVLTPVGGTGGVGTQITVNAVSGGVITSASISANAGYSVLPTNPVSVTGGAGTGATFNLNYAVTGQSITNAGSGYVEQPTVSFSGGGGSGAAAYATVGGTTTVRGLGPATDFATPAGIGFRVGDAGATSTFYWQAIGGAFNGILRGGGSTQNALIQTGGTGGISLQTNNGAQTQFIAAHTASAVNYVQVTGNATTGSPTISTQGSDTNISMQYLAKGSGVHAFQTGSSFNQFRITATTSAVNYLAVTGGAAGAAPVMSATGSDTNIDLTLTPKGTGAVRDVTGGGEQLRVSNTASAVNYVNITGAATGNPGVCFISAQGSDTNISLASVNKGTGAFSWFNGGSTGSRLFRVNGGATNMANHLQIDAAAAGSFPSLSVGSLSADTNVDLALTPKGTGNVRFGTYTGTISAITGYIEIKDSGGTVRRLAVVA
jgi:hypothetical protein